MFDLAIVGMGPAGLSCALTARKRNLNTILLGQSIKTNLIWNTELIDNYPGMPNVSGKDLLTVFQKQAEDLGTTISHGLIRQIMPADDGFMLLQGDNIIEAKSVALCIGVSRPKMISGEADLLGNGISYCATCDAMFYRGKNIAVLSENEDGVEESNFLSTVVNSIDYYIIRKHDHKYLNKETSILEIKIDSFEKQNSSVILKHKYGEKVYDGIFIFRSAISINDLIYGLETEVNYIKVNKNMETNILGLFAAGDCTGQPLQVPKAVGEGNIAAISVAKYLNEIK